VKCARNNLKWLEGRLKKECACVFVREGERGVMMRDASVIHQAMPKQLGNFMLAISFV
jgi:hypothetical protein